MKKIIIFLLVLLMSTTALAQTVFIDDFEDGNAVEWSCTTGGNINATQDEVFKGSYSGNYSGGSSSGQCSYEHSNITKPTSVRYAVNVYDTSATWQQDSPNSGRLTVFKHNSANNLVYYDGSSFQGTGISVSKNQWYVVHLKNINYTSNTYDIVVKYPNATVIGTSTGQLANGATTFNVFEIYQSSEGVYIDDIQYNATNYTNTTTTTTTTITTTTSDTTTVSTDFNGFSQAQMIFLTGFLFILLFAGIRILSLVSTVAWIFAAIALVGVMAFNMEMITFWFAVIVNIVSIGVGMAVRVFYSQRI